MSENGNYKFYQEIYLCELKNKKMEIGHYFSLVLSLCGKEIKKPLILL